jgi:hypothetical protein
VIAANKSSLSLVAPTVIVNGSQAIELHSDQCSLHMGANTSSDSASRKYKRHIQLTLMTTNNVCLSVSAWLTNVQPAGVFASRLLIYITLRRQRLFNDADIPQLTAIAPAMAFAASKEFNVSVVDDDSSGSSTVSRAAYVNMTLGSGSATMNASSSMQFAVNSNANGNTASSTTKATTLLLESDRAQVSPSAAYSHYRLSCCNDALA